ncbi:MAG: DUF3369 domain-containing protein [Thiotrichaceae bacterium]
MTAQRLYTTLRTALKAYQDLVTIAQHQQSLDKIIEAAPILYKIQSHETLFNHILEQIRHLNPIAANHLIIATIDNASYQKGEWCTTIRAGTGRFANYQLELQQHNTLIYICHAIMNGHHPDNLLPHALLLPMQIHQRLLGYIYLEEVDELSDNDKHLLKIMVIQCSVALNNLELYYNLKTANQRNERKNLFLGMAAHDLRNPLGIIIASEEILQEIGVECLNEEQHQCLEWIKANSCLSLNLVNDLLDVAKIEAGKLELDLQPTDILLMINNVVSASRILANTKHIQLHFDCKNCGENIPLPMVDSSKIQQVLNNLLSNAIKYSHPRQHVWIQIQSDNHEVVISVKDEGQGIPKDEVPKLFEPFSKISTAGTAGEMSTGLGLLICRQIIEAHHGRIWVESIVGIGSTFYVAIPPRTPPS